VHQSTIDCDDPVEQAGLLAQAALAAMARLGVAPTPANFQIWYGHCSMRQPELSATLRSLEAGGAAFTASRCADLHEQFFGPTHQTKLIDEACERFEATMRRLLEELDGMSAEAGAYGGKLQELSCDVQAVDGKQALRGLVNRILDETRTMLSRARELEAELDQSSKQMSTMRLDLASARREANVDDLTRIANRRCFDYELQKAAEQAEARRQPMSLLMLDIDHFKDFNDSHGHQAGDQVLKQVAQLLTKSVKGRDLAARYGGEEFAVILPETGLEGARRLAEQICRTVAGHRVVVKATGRDLGRITLSIGCAQQHWGEPAADLLRRADRALYQAKRMGRNRVAVASRLSTSAC
jgi:diguanylate cyclase